MTDQSLHVTLLDGITPYNEAHALQLKLVEQRKAGDIPDTLVLLEHPPVITLGKNADPLGVIASDEELDKRGISTHRIERGGQATYHGPGQIVGYPILDLHGLKIGIRQHVANLEDLMIKTAKKYGVDAGRKDGQTGVFHDQGKIGAVGVRVTRGITYHGFAFNVNPDLTHYQLIVPCGMTDTRVTSIKAITGNTPIISNVKLELVRAFVSAQ
jgi:lipoyl(octanoyl) transferase